MAKVVLGMIGLGNVGTGVARLLSDYRQFSLKRIAFRDPKKVRDIEISCATTTSVEEVINDPEIEVLIEVMGGETPALDYIKQAIEKHKHIVTANKEVLAKHGPELFALARKKGVAIFFEAAVAGGIPLISTLQKGLGANQISSVTGILNGTTNYILSKMQSQGQSFAEALAQAQKQGFAEADPTADVDGYDVAYKLSILAALSFGHFAKPDDVYRLGIRTISSEDMHYAAKFGYCIKLIGMVRRYHSAGKGTHQALEVKVEPMLVPLGHQLAAVSDAFNGIFVRGNAVGEIVMVGPGAGQMPTASAVVGDLINLASALQLPDFASYFQPAIATSWAHVQAADDYSSPYYLRMKAGDTPGVIGKIGTIFGENQINIQTIMQQGSRDGQAEIVVLTGSVKKKDMDSAIAQLSQGAFLKKMESRLAIFDPDTMPGD